MLFVNLSLWKLTTFDIHCSPVAGLSGWIYILFGISGSAFPATIQRELWNLYLQSSAATISIKRIYLAFLSRPVHLTLNGGNIRLWQRRTNDKHSCGGKLHQNKKGSSRYLYYMLKIYQTIYIYLKNTQLFIDVLYDLVFKSLLHQVWYVFWGNLFLIYLLQLNQPKSLARIRSRVNKRILLLLFLMPTLFERCLDF